jgi:hypothetical protein
MTDHKAQVLAALPDFADGCGVYTGEVAKSVPFQFGHNKRTHSAFVRQLLLALEREGLVCRLDDEKPVCWRKAKA